MLCRARMFCIAAIESLMITKLRNRPPIPDIKTAAAASAVLLTTTVAPVHDMGEAMKAEHQFIGSFI